MDVPRADGASPRPATLNWTRGGSDLESPRFHFADLDRCRGSQRRRSVYNPIYHLHERLAMVRGQDTVIPEDEFREIVRVMRGVRLGTRRARNRAAIQRALHRLNSEFGTRYWTKKWLERWPQITNRLNSRNRLLWLNVQDRVDHLFNRVVVAWKHVRIKFPRRRHMPHFSYMIVQLLRFCGRPPEEMIPWFPQLTTRDKIAQTESYWRAICRYNRWPFLTLRPFMTSRT
jgi:hypothetical protein